MGSPKLDRPVLITGTPRAGKTVVWNLLRSSDEFLAIQEPITIWDGGLRSPGHDRRTGTDASPAVRRRITSRLEALLDESGRSRYCDNLSYHALRIPFIAEVLPQARLVHVVRDPNEAVPEILFGWRVRSTLGATFRQRRGNIDPRALPRLAWRFARNYVGSRLSGHRESWGPIPPGLDRFASSHTTAEIAAYQWRRLVEIALEDLAALPHLPVLQVRYDDLVSNPRHEARRIAEFVEAVDPDALVSLACENVHQDYVHHEPCKAEPTPDEWQAIQAITDPLREQLGFDAMASNAGAA